MLHIYISKLIITGSDNGLSPGRRQAIIWTNGGILLIQTLGANFSEILSEIHIFSFKKMYLKMLSAKQLPFCLEPQCVTTVFTNSFDQFSCKLYSHHCDYWCPSIVISANKTSAHNDDENKSDLGNDLALNRWKPLVLLPFILANFCTLSWWPKIQFHFQTLELLILTTTQELLSHNNQIPMKFQLTYTFFP